MRIALFALTMLGTFLSTTSFADDAIDLICGANRITIYPSQSSMHVGTDANSGWCRNNYHYTLSDQDGILAGSNEVACIFAMEQFV